MRGLLRAAVILALVAAGCGSDSGRAERGQGSADALTLRVDTPADGASTSRPEVVVSGAVSTGAQVTVDGRRAELTTSGDLAQFRARVKLEEGENEIEVVASRGGSEDVRRVLRVTRTDEGAGDQADTDPDDQQGGNRGSSGPDDQQGGNPGSSGPDDQQGGPDAAPTASPTDPDDVQGGPQATPTPTGPDDNQGGPPAVRPPPGTPGDGEEPPSNPGPDQP